MIKFKLLNDWNIELNIANKKVKNKIFDKGHIFSPNKEGIYIIEYLNATMSLNIDEMRKSKFEDSTKMFEEISDFEIISNVIKNDNEDDEIKNWRIQVDVKTNLNKLKKIENTLRFEIDKILN